MSRSLEEFVPLEEGKVRLYTCGPTVYHYAHLGNLRAFVFYDVLKRTLLHYPYEVIHVMNITDVGHLTDDADYGQDKLEKGAAREGKSVWDVASYFTQEFLADCKALQILPPDFRPKATEYIDQQIEMVSQLEDKGFTYITDHGVAFDTSKYPSYANLSKMPLDKLCEGARVELDSQKHNPTDFYLWKFSKPEEKRQMEWPSPWGVGFPGWHIECSAMAKALLGETIDIHCGGIDHITVHHTNEIAQSEAASGVQFSRYWMHNNFLTVDAGLKMSKSAENFLRLQTVLDHGYHPLAYRYMCLTAHYRSELMFGWEQMHGAQHTLRKLKQSLYGYPNSLALQKDSSSVFVQDFVKQMENDLDTPKALAVLHEMMSSDLDSQEKRAHLLFFDQYLGLGFAEDIFKEQYLSLDELTEKIIDSEPLLAHVQKRNIARMNKDWATADLVRQQLSDSGYEIEDNKDEMRIRRGI